jgi:hypothetical protein
VASNRGRTDDWVKYRREEAEKAKDRANQVLIESMGNGAALAAAQAKIKDAAMPQNVASKVTDLGGRLDALTFLSTDANEKYFGKWANNMDIATNKFVGNNPKLAGWWETYSSLVNDVRKGTFGATLTPHEKAEFEKTVVTPNTNPKLAIENVKKMHGILEVAAGRQGRAISSKYGAGNVTEALGRDPTSLGVGMNPYAPKTAPTAPTKPAPAGVDAKTWQYMTPEERAKF